MVASVFIFISLFITVFGITYLHYSTRNKERLALIEKGAEASIFGIAKKEKTAPIWKVIILNLALLLMGIGLGIIIGGLLNQAGVIRDIAMPGSIFLMAGTGLLVGFFLTKKMDEEV
ncbi:hypothetical protein JQC67_17415 [Aurantibacter crassamenti]|uniref:DUF6249 domain-containing protein n=1 Tax=Aurantibacter crassamenti TaxID=1837375 RepID=UPI0019399718|nr:DUF6249 domain-containing protein [Aurantibacter crassamenti]MBM1107938.1 hypothetical protein [Aurantibacter crassamenti]